MLMVSYLEIALWRCVVLMSLEWSEIWPLLCDLWVQEHENVTSIQKGQWDICSKEGIFLCPKLPLYRKLCDRKAHVYCGVKIRVSNLRFGVFLRIYKKRFSRQNVLQIFLSREIIYIYIFIHSFIHSVFCLTTGPKPPLKRFLHIVRSRASSFKWEYPLLSLRSSSSFLRILPCLLVTSISPFIFPAITCFRRQFLRKLWPIQLAFRFLISCRIFLC